MTGIARTAVDDRIGRAAEESREFSAVFREEYPRLWAVAFALLGDTYLAEEITMEAFSTAFSSWARVRRVENRSAYLRKIVLNLCRSRWRRRKIELRVQAVVHGFSEREPNTAWASKDSDARIDVWSILASLPDRQRACVVLRYYGDLTQEEIAETLECSLGTVKSHLHRARKALEARLDPDVRFDA